VKRRGEERREGRGLKVGLVVIVRHRVKERERERKRERERGRCTQADRVKSACVQTRMSKCTGRLSW